MNCDANTLLEAASAAGYTNMSPVQMDAVEVYLLCSLSNGGTGGQSGSGSPEGVVTATPGTTYLDTNAPYDFWVKATGTGNTGWVMKVE